MHETTLRRWQPLATHQLWPTKRTWQATNESLVRCNLRIVGSWVRKFCSSSGSVIFCFYIDFLLDIQNKKVKNAYKRKTLVFDKDSWFIAHRTSCYFFYLKIDLPFGILPGFMEIELANHHKLVNQIDQMKIALREFAYCKPNLYTILTVR